MAQVILKEVFKSYGSVAAVRDLSLIIEDMEFVVLVGPSGCGKSTTLRVVAGLEELTSGTVQIGDRVVNDLPPKDRDVAMVFQNYALYQHMSVYDNLAFGLRNKKTPEARIREEISRASKILGIEELMGRRPHQLSGGQQQRVALGRCIVRNPAVFLFDEPLSNLDAQLRSQMRVELKELRQRVPTTSIYVTHDQVEAMTLGDRIVVMRDGLVQQVGSPLDLYRQPANRFVAGFIGSPAMNFFDVGVEATDAGLIATAPDIEIMLVGHPAERLKPYVARTVTVGVRPEHIGLGEANADSRFTFDVKVQVTEQLGSEQLLDVRVGPSLLRVAAVDPAFSIRSGERVRLNVGIEDLHFFDPDTERVIP